MRVKRSPENEQEIHEQGLVSVLRQIHDELDAAVAEAYGWPVDLSDEEILARLVASNHERAEEERRGLVSWLRPEFQNPSGKQQTAIAIAEPDGRGQETRTQQSTVKAKPQPWPKELSKQAAAVAAALASFGAAATAEEIAKHFGRATRQGVELVGDCWKPWPRSAKPTAVDQHRYIAA